MDLLKDEEKEELFEIAQESFFEDNFEYSLDENTIKENYFAALRIFHEKYVKADEVCEAVANGEILDEVTVKLAIDELVISYKFANQFRMKLTGKGLVNPATIELSDDRNQLAMCGNELIGRFATSKDYDDYEIGKWMLYKAMTN